jgi:hypothetical protein
VLFSTQPCHLGVSQGGLICFSFGEDPKNKRFNVEELLLARLSKTHMLQFSLSVLLAVVDLFVMDFGGVVCVAENWAPCGDIYVAFPAS